MHLYIYAVDALKPMTENAILFFLFLLVSQLYDATDRVISTLGDDFCL